MFRSLQDEAIVSSRKNELKTNNRPERALDHEFGVKSGNDNFSMEPGLQAS